MSASNKNYFQHIMDIIIGEKSYEDLEDLYDSDNITVDSLKKAHTDPKRGNLPTGKKPKDFYEIIIRSIYDDDKSIRDFARRLDKSLDRDHIFPYDWLPQRDEISGFSLDFNVDIFGSYIVDLLEIDKIKTRPIIDDVKKNTKRTYSEEQKLSLQKPIKKGGVSENENPALSFSSRFLNLGARTIMNADDSIFESELKNLSDVFKNIVNIEFKASPTEFDIKEGCFLHYLCDWIADYHKLSGPKEILKIKGPLGSYKNRIMQYLYLALARKSDYFVPIYINVASYEKAAEGDEKIGEADFLEAFNNDIEIAKSIFLKESSKKPLLFLDGIRDFTCRNESFYYSINERIKRCGWYLIICMDTDFTINNQNKFDVHPLVSNNFECYLRIRSMNLNRKKESISFIENCVRVFNVPLPKDVRIDQIYDNLVRLSFLTIDAYWLTCILRSHLSDILNSKNNISGLYNAICLTFLGSHKSVESAAEFAYEFELGKGSFNNTNPYYDLRWKLIRKHRSVLDFLIARYYIRKVSELNLENGTREQNIEKLSFFNMVLQKNITRFVIAMLKGVDDYERQIMIIAKKYYDDLELFGKSELTFWMARLQNPMRKKECVELLRLYNRKEMARYKENNFSSLEEKRKAAFLIRGINVSLIYENDKDALKYYLDSLLTDKIANSINRGFHLEYYGDKPYIPNKSLLDFEDDITSGEATLTVICLSLDRRIRRLETPSIVALLEIMTLCNLIQARIEYTKTPHVLDVYQYIDKCIRYLEWIMQHRIVKGLRDVCIYFYWMSNELQSYKKTHSKIISHYQADVYNKFTCAHTIKRTGWVDLKISNPENIVEHMYNCWLIGMLYLPNDYEDSDYSKNEILQMLLIHDLGETETGDISRPIKLKNKSYYDQEERSVMHGLFLSGTYPSSVDLSRYMDSWNSWDSHSGINYRIAKDIDNIQTIDQFCRYCLNEPSKFSEDDILYWLSGMEEIETDIGKSILEILIFDNPIYKNIISRYDSE